MKQRVELELMADLCVLFAFSSAPGLHNQYQALN